GSSAVTSRTKTLAASSRPSPWRHWCEILMSIAWPGTAIVRPPSASAVAIMYVAFMGCFLLKALFFAPTLFRWIPGSTASRGKGPFGLFVKVAEPEWRELAPERGFVDRLRLVGHGEQAFRRRQGLLSV